MSIKSLYRGAKGSEIELFWGRFRFNLHHQYAFAYNQLELNLEEDDGYTFNFKKGKWVFEEWYGEHQEFEYKNQKEGIIESLPSKLKVVYKRYLNVLEEGEMDIVQCGWTDYRMSEK